MGTTTALRTTVIALSFAAGSVNAEESIPVVYEDDYVTVHAGIPESGTRAVHLGDAVSLVIAVVFDDGQVQIESLDDTVFQRAFSASPSIRLYSTADVTTRKDSDDRVRATSHWRMQVLDCPQNSASCPGSRSYDLPLMTIAYQLMDDAGSTTDGRAARFRPWPGKIDVAASVAIVDQSAATLTDILPGGAYDSAQPVIELAPARSALFAAGTLLLLAGFIARTRERRPVPLLTRSSDSNSRWERTLARLSDDTISDDEFSDLLRRCTTWYCIDELGRNPYTWLGEVTDHTDAPADIREFFLDVLQQERVDPGRRAHYLDKLKSIAEHVRHASAAEQTA